MNRRSLIKSLGMLTMAGSLTPKSLVASEPVNQFNTRRSLRIAHLTDIHISDKSAALRGYEKCICHVQSLEDIPDLIINGGDTIEDALYKSRSETNTQWQAWHHVNRMHKDIEMQYCLGNHDIWGLYSGKKDGSYGKQVALEMMHNEKAYYSIDRNGWKIIMLDSTQKKKNGLWYTARLDEVQFEWLKDELQHTPAHIPIMIVSHIPILCANVFLDDVHIRNGKFQIPGSWVHTDVKEIVALFAQYPNVKLCLSGHIHMQDAVTYRNVSYYCNGAVSADWWRSNEYNGTKAGYALIDLYDDGTFQNTYVQYT